MQSRHVLTILAARDFHSQVRFYADAFSWARAVDTNHYAEFELPGGQRIGIYEREGFGRNFGATPGEMPEGTVSPFELYLQVVDLAIATESLLECGARLLSAAAPREWGDTVAYFADPEGNVLALAAVKDVKPPVGNYSRDEFVRRVSDVLLRSGVADAQTLARDLESSVHFPMLERCGLESQMFGGHCVLRPGHDGYCQNARGSRWTRLGSSGSE